MLSLRRLHLGGDRWSVGACPARDSTRARARAVRAPPRVQSSMCPSAYSAPTRQRVRINARYPRGDGDTPGGTSYLYRGLRLVQGVVLVFRRLSIALFYGVLRLIRILLLIPALLLGPYRAMKTGQLALLSPHEAPWLGTCKLQSAENTRAKLVASGGATLDDGPGSCCQRVWCW